MIKKLKIILILQLLVILFLSYRCYSQNVYIETFQNKIDDIFRYNLRSSEVRFLRNLKDESIEVKVKNHTNSLASAKSAYLLYENSSYNSNNYLGLTLNSLILYLEHYSYVFGNVNEAQETRLYELLEKVISSPQNKNASKEFYEYMITIDY